MRSGLLTRALVAVLFAPEVRSGVLTRALVAVVFAPEERKASLVERGFGRVEGLIPQNRGLTTRGLSPIPWCPNSRISGLVTPCLGCLMTLGCPSTPWTESPRFVSTLSSGVGPCLLPSTSPPQSSLLSPPP